MVQVYPNDDDKLRSNNEDEDVFCINSVPPPTPHSLLYTARWSALCVSAKSGLVDKAVDATGNTTSIQKQQGVD